MSHPLIHIPSGGAFISLVEAHQIPQVLLGVESAVSTSFAVDKCRMTQREATRRVNKALDIFCQLRRDKHWSVDRITQSLTKFLRCELDGEPWEPEERDAWIQPIR